MIREGLKAAFPPAEFSQNALLLLAVLSTLLLALTLTPAFAFSLLLFHHCEDIVQDPSLPRPSMTNIVESFPFISGHEEEGCP